MGSTPTRTYVYDKFFDDKVASSKAFEYSGGQGVEGEKWRKVTRGYFVQKCPDLLPVLNWAECMDDRSTTKEATCAKMLNQELMTELDVFELSRASNADSSTSVFLVPPETHSRTPTSWTA